jgi:hypothetical protein
VSGLSVAFIKDLLRDAVRYRKKFGPPDHLHNRCTPLYFFSELHPFPGRSAGRPSPEALVQDHCQAPKFSDSLFASFLTTKAAE